MFISIFSMLKETYIQIITFIKFEPEGARGCVYT